MPQSKEYKHIPFGELINIVTNIPKKKKEKKHTPPSLKKGKAKH